MHNSLLFFFFYFLPPFSRIEAVAPQRDRNLDRSDKRRAIYAVET